MFTCIALAGNLLLSPAPFVPGVTNHIPLAPGTYTQIQFLAPRDDGPSTLRISPIYGDVITVPLTKDITTFEEFVDTCETMAAGEDE
jgi:hypothetical protein